MALASDGVVGGSFRDPSGFVFRFSNSVYRQVNYSYAETLQMVEESGLYTELTNRHLLVHHSDADVRPPDPARAARVLLPEQIPFVAYPYEWCFGQLKDAAIATLTVQQVALEYGMTLKDASAFNIQFLRGRPTLIDSLSFEPYVEGMPWTAYRQFCEHFLGPLMLVATVDPWLARLSALTADGVALETLSRLLPRTTWLRPSFLLHVHLHARSVRHYGGKAVPSGVKKRGLSREGMRNLVDGLLHTVQRIDWSPAGTQWADYESTHNYSDREQQAKSRMVGELLDAIRPDVVWDMGANTGEFSRVAIAAGARVVSMDVDPSAVELNYRRMRESAEERLHPLWIDLRVPSCNLGWANEERDSLARRSDADVVLALALVHHLAIGANLPLPRIVEWFSRLAPHLVIEFVPKADPQAQRLLVSREDIFADYTRSAFEAALQKHFSVMRAHEVTESGRMIYHGVRR